MNDVTDTEATVPCDLGAERSVLGAMLLSKAAVGDVLDVVRGPDFANPHHETIFRAILDLYDRGEPADVTTVCAALTRSGDLQKVGGPVKVAELVEQVPTATSARYYAEIVAEKAVLARHQEAGRKIMHLARTEMLTGAEISEEARTLVDAAAGGDQRVESLSDAFARMIDELERGAEPGWPTGYGDVDQVLNPVTGGKFVILGARPGTGKSVFITDWARHVAHRLNGRALIVSLEMTTVEILHRLTSAACKVPYGKFTRRDPSAFTEDEWEQIARFQAMATADDNLVIAFSPGAGLGEVRALIRRHRPDVVFVDYLQLMGTAAGETRNLEVSALSRGLKILSQTEDVPIVVASQLRRPPPGTKDHRPQLSELRDSGSLEQDADAVLLLHRPDQSDANERPGEVDVIVAKQRAGMSGMAKTLATQLHYARFVSMA